MQVDQDIASPAAVLAASHAYCHRQTRTHARSFYFASIALPAEKKRAAFAVYAFCRYADDLIDRAGSPEEARVSAERVGVEFDRLVSGMASHPPFAPAFAWAVRRYGIEKAYFLDLLAGVGGDAGRVRIADWLQLREYCYQVASVVGLMMARIFELKDTAAQERAIELGLAMQLTNIVRDVGEDYRLDRIYLPAEEMRAYDVADVDLDTGEVGAPTRSLLSMQIDRAREYYRNAEAGIPYLADDGSQLTVWLMRHVYAGILDEVERIDYQVLRRRATVSFARKCRLAVRAWRDYRRTRPARRLR
jgi:phytoene synthase